MRRTHSVLSLLAIAVSGLSGCSALQTFGFLPGSVTELVNHRQPGHGAAGAPLAVGTPLMAAANDANATNGIVPVAYVDDNQRAASQGVVDCDPAAPNPLSDAASASFDPAQPCRETQAYREAQPCAVAQPYGLAPYGYFNPYLIDPNEYLCDGGDHPPAARARAGDQIIGVDLEDTVVRYTTEAGDVHVQPSNRVCVYAPRFAAVRKVTGAESGGMAVGAIGVERPQGPARAQLTQPGLAVTGRDRVGRGEAVRGPDAMRDRNRGVPVERVLQPELAEDVLQVLANLSLVNRGLLRDNEKPWLSLAAQSAVVWSVDMEVGVTVNNIAPVTLIRDQSAEALVVYDFPDAGRLRICKLADKSNALPGEIVTFILRVDNVGDSAVGNIVITDNLVTRLEYIPDSQTSTVQAQFDAQANEGQSLRLTWKLDQDLKVGEGTTIEFKCRVR